ncbi:MAG: polysaccharide biosynthesis/export family protein [Flavobacteriaceae bacterium]|nr:polysaccharide biosynthesis/export family protein [Flavobacteriaceae bacterium]
MKKIFIVFILIGLLSSCLSKKQITYFQGDPIPKTAIYKLSNQPYRLQINDVVSLDIKAEDENLVTLFKTEKSGGSGDLYFGGYTVDRHGNIRIPYLGEVNILGYTEKEAREKIEQELTTYFKNSKALFVTLKLAGIKFTITGEVGSPGTKHLMQNQVSIVDALANAGEIKDMGNRKEVIVIRKTLDGVQKYTLDLTDIAIFNSEYFYIQPNDVIYVSPLPQKTWGTGTNGLQTFTTLVSILSFIASSVILIKNL